MPTYDNGLKRICWFYITDSYNYIELGEVKLFQSSKESIEKYPNLSEYLDYYYIRFLEDFFDILPEISFSMPSDIYNFINSYEKLNDINDKLNIFLDDDCFTKEQEEIYFLVSKLLYYATLDTGHLRFKSRCSFYHIDDYIVINYDFLDKDENGCKVFSATRGEYKIKYSIFLEEVEDMLNRFFNCMEVQIKSLKNNIQENTYIIKDIDTLKDTKDTKKILEIIEKEQKERKEYFFDILNKVKNKNTGYYINWNKVRNAINTIKN